MKIKEQDRIVYWIVRPPWCSACRVLEEAVGSCRGVGGLKTQRAYAHIKSSITLLFSLCIII